MDRITFVYKMKACCPQNKKHNSANYPFGAQLNILWNFRGIRHYIMML